MTWKFCDSYENRNFIDFQNFILGFVNHFFKICLINIWKIFILQLKKWIWIAFEYYFVSYILASYYFLSNQLFSYNYYLLFQFPKTWKFRNLCEYSVIFSIFSSIFVMFDVGSFHDLKILQFIFIFSNFSILGEKIKRKFQFNRF